MHIVTNKIRHTLDTLPSSTYLLNRDFLLFDIETTGFSREYAIIYMIGCIYKKDNHYEYCNLFAESPSEEHELIYHFFTMLKDFNCIVHFNGNGFDIPFLLARAEKYRIKEQISHMESIDIYDLLRPLRKCLAFPDLKLDTIQNQLGYFRKDTCTGGDLIQVYQNYANRPYKPYYNLLLLHNKEDVEGMIHLLPLIDIFELIDGLILNEDFELLTIEQEANSIKVIYTLPYQVSMDFELSHKGSVFKLFSGSDTAKLTLPLYEDKKKLFFENYKDYIYLPEKDEVVHKSIATFMPTHKKEKAKKSNCYVSHLGNFIPVFRQEDTDQPFKDHFKSKDYYALVALELDSNFFNKQLVGFLKTCKEA